MEKFLEALASAEKNLQAIDHMVYITFPLIKDKRLLLKIIQEIKKVITSCITSILQYEYVYKRVNLSRDPHENFKTFSEKLAPRYCIKKDEIRLIQELFDFVEKHKESSFEFLKNDKIIILSNEMGSATLSLEKIKEFLNLAKSVIKKTKAGFKIQA